MRVLVTGHNGYIGSVMTPLLEQAGHDVVGLDFDLFAACTFGEVPPEIESIRKDVRDVEVEDLVGFDAVLHLAAVCNDPIGDLNPQATYDINHLRLGPARAEGQGGRGPAVPVLLVLQPVRQRGRRRAARRERRSSLR